MNINYLPFISGFTLVNSTAIADDNDFNNKGIPVAGAKIERLLVWKDDTGETDTVITDKDGNFNLPLIKDKVKLAKFSTFVMHQEI